MVDDGKTIKAHVVDFFKDLYTDTRITRPFLDGMKFKTLDDSQRDWLEHPITEDEVKKVVWNFENDNVGSGWFLHGIYND